MEVEGAKFKRALGGWEAVSNHSTTITITVPITTPTILFSITYRVSVVHQQEITIPGFFCCDEWRVVQPVVVTMTEATLWR